MSAPMSDASTIRERALALNHEADQLIRAIYENRTAWAALQEANQKKLRSAYILVREQEATNIAWIRLLNHLGYGTPLLSIEPAIASFGPNAGNTSLDALLLFALRQEQWIRNPEDWLPESGDNITQITELAQHLFARYSVPGFMKQAWFEGFSPEGWQHQNWYIHIGQGQNIRRAEIPLPLTEKAAHHFLFAPEQGTITGALRWGQVLALGGSEALASAIIESSLSEILPEEEFWYSVLHFFVNNPQLPLHWVGPIVDFILAQKFGDWKATPYDPRIGYDAPEPTFTMKGRTLNALYRRVEEWHEQLARDSKRPRNAWKPCGIAPFQVEEKDEFGAENIWLITELSSSQALMDEGREMRHCVFRYAANCINGQTAIWSLRVKPVKASRTRRLLTIEVNLQRHAIVQVRGRCNLTLGGLGRGGRWKTAGTLLRRWAQEQHLSIGCGL